MRFMIWRKADADVEAGVMPKRNLIAAMGRYNENPVKAGAMVAGDGLQPSSKGAHTKFSGDRPSVFDGPFAETKELVAGYWLIQTDSLQEAVEWVRRYPYPRGEDVEFEVEIRKVYEAADFGAEFMPELREAKERLRDRLPESGQQLGCRSGSARQKKITWLVDFAQPHSSSIHGSGFPAPSSIDTGVRHAIESLPAVRRPMRGRVQVLREVPGRQGPGADDPRRFADGRPGVAGMAQ